MHEIETGFVVAAVALLAVPGWALFVHFSPYRTCRWCAGRRRGRRCWRCKGSKLTRRIGAKTVHKVKLSLQQAWAERGAQSVSTPGGDS
jgi:hypothetical protein